jgi:hypothetical protein
MFISVNIAIALIYHTLFNNFYIVEIYERKINIPVTNIDAIDSEAKSHTSYTYTLDVGEESAWLFLNIAGFPYLSCIGTYSVRLTVKEHRREIVSINYLYFWVPISILGLETCHLQVEFW